MDDWHPINAGLYFELPPVGCIQSLLRLISYCYVIVPITPHISMMYAPGLIFDDTHPMLLVSLTLGLHVLQTGFEAL
jgi:hypothetical protein